ncbi:hypothetical protein FQA39_LY09415 [Lamprigera yunnana]|nr:hypothetical protein FQA39_LY09415 [Lamprigera yunnana]
MVFSCCVPTYDSRNNSKNVKFHRLPYLDVDIFNQWLKHINRADLKEMSPKKVYKSYRICHKHFSEANLISTPFSSRSGLIVTAFPTLYISKECTTQRGVNYDGRISTTINNSEPDTNNQATNNLKIQEYDDFAGTKPTHERESKLQPTTPDMPFIPVCRIPKTRKGIKSKLMKITCNTIVSKFV